jgi:hypothetical protein
MPQLYLLLVFLLALPAASCCGTQDKETDYHYDMDLPIRTQEWFKLQIQPPVEEETARNALARHARKIATARSSEMPSAYESINEVRQYPDLIKQIPATYQHLLKTDPSFATFFISYSGELREHSLLPFFSSIIEPWLRPDVHMRSLTNDVIAAVRSIGFLRSPESEHALLTIARTTKSPPLRQMARDILLWNSPSRMAMNGLEDTVTHIPGSGVPGIPGHIPGGTGIGTGDPCTTMLTNPVLLAWGLGQ